MAMLDAPVSGGDVGAINGTLSIMVGGDEAVFNHCLPVFEAMGTNINLIGSNGAGQTTKLCNQIAVSVNNMAMAEALMLAATSDLDVQKVIDAISGGAAGSWQLSNLGPRIAAGDFDPGFYGLFAAKGFAAGVAGGQRCQAGPAGREHRPSVFQYRRARGLRRRGDPGTDQSIRSAGRQTSAGQVARWGWRPCNSN